MSRRALTAIRVLWWLLTGRGWQPWARPRPWPEVRVTPPRPGPRWEGPYR